MQFDRVNMKMATKTTAQTQRTQRSWSYPPGVFVWLASAGILRWGESMAIRMVWGKLQATCGGHC